MAVEVLGSDPDLELTIAPAVGTELPRVDADAVVTTLAPPAIARLLFASARMQAFSIEKCNGIVGRTSLRLVHDELGELSFAELAGAIKESIQQSRHSQ